MRRLDMPAMLAVTLVVTAATTTANPQDSGAASERATGAEAPAPFKVRFDESAYALDMLPIPGSEDGTIAPFWMSRTEVGWEAFDVFVYRLDLELENAAEQWADTESRPSKPYLPPDRGFGHEGYAAISLTHHAATKFCEWLTKRTGMQYRLPTEAEWMHAALAGGDGPYTGDVDREDLGEYAWYRANTRRSPQPVATKKANAWGLHDVHGNVAEWVNRADGTATTKGGSYRDTPKYLSVDEHRAQDASWNASDPQIPKSTWWLSDGPMVGFRVVCTGPVQPEASDPAAGDPAPRDADGANAPSSPTPTSEPTPTPTSTPIPTPASASPTRAPEARP